MRFESNGIFFVFIVPASRGSFIALSFTLSRWARDLYTIHEKTTVSHVLVSPRPGTISAPSPNGARLTHSIASSFDFTFQIQKPAIRSFDSGNGPLVTACLPPENLTGAPFEVG